MISVTIVQVILKYKSIVDDDTYKTPCMMDS